MFRTCARATLVGAVQARRQAGFYQAVELEELAQYARATEGDEFAYLEVSTQLRISDRAAQQRLRLACTLTERLPRTLDAVREGRIEEFKARLIADAVTDLSDEHATLVEDRVLERAAEQTPAQLRAALAKAVLTVDPEGAEERRQEKVRERRVCSQPTEDGQAVLSLYHSAARIALIRAALRGRAVQLRADADETRTLEQIEADLAADLLLGREEALRAVEVHLTMPATTATGRDDRPAEFEGVGPITAPEAREWAAEAKSWRWIRSDPDTGEVVDLTYPSYRPPAALAAFIKVRDRTCQYPGCTRPARLCEIDHRVPWPTGPTCDANCGCLCKRHHRAKHEGGWTIQQVKPGRFRWISPLRFSHPVTPQPVDDPDPPPY